MDIALEASCELQNQQTSSQDSLALRKSATCADILGYIESAKSGNHVCQDDCAKDNNAMSFRHHDNSDEMKWNELNGPKGNVITIGSFNPALRHSRSADHIQSLCRPNIAIADEIMTTIDSTSQIHEPMVSNPQSEYRSTRKCDFVHKSFGQELLMIRNLAEYDELFESDRSGSIQQTNRFHRVLRGIQKSVKMFFKCVRTTNQELEQLEDGDDVEMLQEKHDKAKLCNNQKVCQETNEEYLAASFSQPVNTSDVPLSAIHVSNGESLTIEYSSTTTTTTTTTSTTTLVSPITNIASISEKTIVFDSKCSEMAIKNVNMFPLSGLLLPPIHPADVGKKCLVLDLDETLVHSTFEAVPADLVIPVKLGEGIIQPIYVNKRPGVSLFLEKVCELFEVVIFTASLATYADPVIDFLDANRSIRYRLYREACVQRQGLFIKDLSTLGRPLDQILIIDNSPASYLFHPNNALAIRSWFTDPNDQDLLYHILPNLLYFAKASDVYAWKSLVTLN